MSSWPRPSDDPSRRTFIGALTGTLCTALPIGVAPAPDDRPPPADTVVRPEQFGAGSANVPDDTAIQTALDACAQRGGGVVQLTQRIHLLRRPLRARSKVHLRGLGSGTVLQMSVDRSALDVSGVTDFTLSDCRVRGDRQLQRATDTNGITATGGGVAGLRIVRVAVESFPGAGILLLAADTRRSAGVRISDCRIRDVGGHGILLQDFVDDVRVERCDVAEFGRVTPDRCGITVGRDGTDCFVTDCLVDGVGAAGASPHGISLDTLLRGGARGNTVLNAIGFGIEIGFCREVVVAGNVIHGGARAGIALSGRGDLVNADCIVAANTIVAPGAQGVYAFLYSPTAARHERIAIVGNTIRAPATQSGIELNYVTDGIVGANVVVGAAKSGIFADHCDGMSYTGNVLRANNAQADQAHGGLRLSQRSESGTAARVAGNLVTGSGIRDLFYTLDGALSSQRFIDGDPKPCVALDDAFATQNTRSTRIVDFADGREGQMVTILFGDALTSIGHTDRIRNRSSRDVVGAPQTTVTYRRIAGVWYQLG